MSISKKITALFGKGRDESTGLDGYSLSPQNPYYDFHLAIHKLLQEANQGTNPSDDAFVRQAVSKMPLLKSEPAEQIRLAHALAERIVRWLQRPASERHGFYEIGHINWAFEALFAHLMRRSLPYSESDLVRLLNTLGPVPAIAPSLFPLTLLLNQVERFAQADGLTPALRLGLEGLKTPAVEARPQNERLLDSLDKLLLGEAPEHRLETGEAWVAALQADLLRLDPAGRLRWRAVLAHVLEAKGARPSNRWLESGRPLLQAIGQQDFSRCIRDWLGAAAVRTGQPMPERAAAALSGLAWMCALLEDAELARVLGDLAIACYQKIAGVGARSKKVGNACVWSLSAMPGVVGVSELVRVQAKAKYGDAQRLIETAMQQAADKAGMSVGDLEELSLPGYNLDGEGRLVQHFGGYTAELSIQTALCTHISWLDPTGKTQKSIPAFVKQNYPEELKGFQRQAEAVQQALLAQRDRLERLMVAQPVWPYASWQQRYLEHPLLAQLARRLIWHFRQGERSQLGAWRAGKVVDLQDQPLSWLGPECEVRLWHPLAFPAETVGAWRRWLETRQVTQPFKQAHREIYALTEAEIETFTYSNRFAAHVLKQHQLAALCRQRGWVYALQGGYDSDTAASRALPQVGLEAHFFVQGVYGQDRLADSGVCLLVTTDQVRFVDSLKRPVPLSEVPALVFSEVMRDVDLFVGVCSVGNDPDWRERGEMPAYNAYWQQVSFGNLSSTAETRKEVLERLLPRLKIAAQCEIRGRFLTVRGQRRTYKIHLGSGNILMEPNDQYLCIVPDFPKSRQTPAGLYLPFEGDSLLSVILSKAFLLAADDQIRDPTILRQIEGE